MDEPIELELGSEAFRELLCDFDILSGRSQTGIRRGQRLGVQTRDCDSRCLDAVKRRRSRLRHERK